MATSKIIMKHFFSFQGRAFVDTGFVLLLKAPKFRTLSAMSLARALVWNTGVQVVGKAISTVLGIFIVGLMTRLLLEEGFGMYSTANAFLAVFALLLDLGLNVTFIALLGEHAGDEKFEKRCVSALFTLRIVSAVLIIGLLAPLVGWFTNYPLPIKLAIIGLIGSFIFPSINQVVIGVQQRRLSLHMNAVGEVVGRCILFFGLLGAVRFGWDLFAVSLLISAGSLAHFILNIVSAYRFGGFYWNWDPAFWKMALARSWPVGVSIAFNLIYFKADTLILGWIRPQTEVGIYGAAYRVFELLITVPFMYAGILLPILSQQWAAKQREKFSSLMSHSLDAMLILTAPLIAGTLVLGPRILAVVAGENFTASGNVMRILIFAAGAIYLNTVISHAIVALNVQRKMIPFYILVAIITLIGYLLFIPEYGMWAAAWLTVGSETAILAASWHVLSRSAAAWPHAKILIASTLAATGMGLVIWYFFPFHLGWLILLGALSYVVLLYLLGGVPKELITQLLSFRRSTEKTV
jgi:O-antigen/teichoic acid export membrane protein